MTDGSKKRAEVLKSSKENSSYTQMLSVLKKYAENPSEKKNSKNKQAKNVAEDTTNSQEQENTESTATSPAVSTTPPVTNAVPPALPVDTDLDEDDDKDLKANTPLKNEIFKTVEYGTISDIKKVFKKYPECANITRGDDKETLLMAAIKACRNSDVINLLLRNNAATTKRTKSGKNSIMYAVRYGDLNSSLETLVKHDAPTRSMRRNKIIGTDIQERTAFDYARMNKEYGPYFITLLKKYCDEPGEEPEPEEEEPFELPSSATLTEEEELSAKKIEAELTKNALPEEETPPSQEAPFQIYGGETLTVIPAETQTEPVPVTVKDPVPQVKPFNKTYLFDYEELESDDDPVIEDENYDPYHTFIEDADKRDLQGRTKLMKASKNGDLKLVENLIFSNADVNAQDNEGWTALMFACRFSTNANIVKTLIRNGAKTETKNNYGITALRLAAGFNSNSTITAELLTNHTVAENEVRAAFIYAITSNAQISTLELFQKKGIAINAPYDGKTPLMYAAQTNKDTKIIGWLLSCGAKTTYRTTTGMTAFDFAKMNKNLPHDKNYWELNTASSGGASNQ